MTAHGPAFRMRCAGMLALGRRASPNTRIARTRRCIASASSTCCAPSATPTRARSHGWRITRETARYLALWMAFDDIVRVAELKSRACRARGSSARSRSARASCCASCDHFKPGVPEFAALLPPELAHALTRWDRRRQARGRAPLALPLKIGAHTVLGMLSLRALAGLHWLRPHGPAMPRSRR